MTREPNEIELTLARTVRSSLERFQRTADEVHHAVNDLVAACSSARVANTLPPMMRAQLAAASLAASLEALSRFVTVNLPPALAGAEPGAWETAEAPVAQAAAPASEPSVASPPAETPISEPPAVPADSQASESAASEPQSVAPPEPVASATESHPAASPEEVPETPAETVASSPASELLLAQERVPEGLENDFAGSVDFMDLAAALAGSEPLPEEPEPFPNGEPPSGFDISGLPGEVQELHRRANRVAKVSMQDIQLLRPEDVRLGREHRDLCFRLREDLERARKEYDRRFQAILGHPVDYFYDWLVEILADGDPQLLGEYPYPSAALRR